MNNILLYLVSNAFRIYIIMRFCENFFSFKDISKYIKYVAFIGFFVLNSILYLVFKNSYINLFSNIVPFVLITYLYNLKWQSRALFTISIYIVELFIDGITYNTIHLLFDDKMQDTGIEATLILYLVELQIEHFKKKDKFRSQNTRNLHFISIIVVILGSLIIGVLTMKGYNTYILIISVVLLSINIIVFALYDNVLKSEQLWYEKELLKRQNDAYNNQIKLWEENKRVTQILKHDMKNHIIDMEISLKNGKYEELSIYMKNLRQSLDIKDEFIKSGNVEIDSIINYKLKQIELLTSNISYNINIPKEIFIENTDWNVILGNLLDNSIEALQKCDKNRRFFKIQITYNQGMIKIFIENAYTSVLNRKNDIFKTTKKNNLLHGIGIESVKNTIQKYNGIINFNYDETSFKVEIVLCSKLILK